MKFLIRALSWAALIFLVMYVPYELTGLLSLQAMWLSQHEYPFPYGFYLGPLWRDHLMGSSAFGASLVCPILYLLCGFVGLACAALTWVIVQKKLLIRRLLVWSGLVFIGLLVSGLVSAGPMDDGPVSDRTFWGCRLSDMLPNFIRRELIAEADYESRSKMSAVVE